MVLREEYYLRDCEIIILILCIYCFILKRNFCILIKIMIFYKVFEKYEFIYFKKICCKV